MLKLALSGKKRSGKNTCASLFLQELSPKASATLAFADALKDAVKIFFPWIPNQLLTGESQFRDIYYPELQKYTQNLGISCLSTRDLIKYLADKIKEINPEILLDIIKYKYQILKENYSSVNNSLIMITDIRFVNEFQWAKQEGFYTLRIKRNSILDELDELDKSEVSQDKIDDLEFDYIIDNSRNLVDLSKKITEISNTLSFRYV